METEYTRPKDSLLYGNNYVYINVEYHYNKGNQTNTYTRKCIGKIDKDKKFIPNKFYFEYYNKETLSNIEPNRSDSLSFGANLAIDKVIQDSKLDKALDALEEKDKLMVLDLASYMLQQNSAVYQHFKSYAFRNAIFSKKIYDDTVISNFLESDCLSDSKTDVVLDNWVENFINNSKMYICYDSTNINCKAEGVTLAEFGHAKDDKTKEQVNIEYSVRQEDGLPILYTAYPGSIVDVVECSTMIARLKKLGFKKLCIIMDRGYVSKANIIDFDKKNLDFLLLLKENMDEYKNIVKLYKDEIKDHSLYYDTSRNIYCNTYKYDLFCIGNIRYCHIIYDNELANDKTKTFLHRIDDYENEIKNHFENKKILNDSQKKRLENYFDIKYYADKPNVIKKYSKNCSVIDEMLGTLGYYVIVTSRKMTAIEAYDSYSKRDCVEKEFEVLKSELGLSSFNVHSNQSVKSKIFISFIASIIRNLIFSKTASLRIKDRKSFTFNAIINELEKIEATLNLKTGKRSLRYHLTKKQKKICECLSLDENDFIEEAKKLPK